MCCFCGFHTELDDGTDGNSAIPLPRMDENREAPTTANLVVAAARLADHFRQHPRSIQNEFPTSELLAIVNAGLLGATLPLRLGGAGYGVEHGFKSTLLHVLREIGRGNLPLGRVYEGHVDAILLVHQFGSCQQVARVADLVLRSDHVFGVWNTGPAKNLQLTPWSAGGYRLSGSKTFATGAGRIQQAIVTAELPDGGWQMCLVPLSEVEFYIRPNTWDPFGMGATESSTVDFPDIIISKDALIGRPGDYYSEPTFTSGTLRFCAVQLGGAQALFASVCKFVDSQGRGSDPFQLQRLGQLAVLMESADQWVRRASEWLDEVPMDSRSLPVRAQMMRIATEEICTRVIQLVELTIGARGMAAAEPFSHILRDLQMYLRQAGFDQAFQAVGRSAIQSQVPHV